MSQGAPREAARFYTQALELYLQSIEIGAGRPCWGGISAFMLGDAESPVRRTSNPCWSCAPLSTMTLPG